MTELDRTAEPRDCGADVAAYALGALEADESDAFARHLETCSICRDELASFQQVVDALPMSVPQHRAPPALRRRVLAQAGGGAERHGTAGRHDPASRRSLRRWLPSFAASRTGLALGAGLAAIAIAFGGVELGSSGAIRTKVFSAQVVGAAGSAEVRVTAGHAELVVHHFAAPPAGEIYEVWLGRPDQKPQPTNALFSVTASGDGDVDVPGNLHGVNQVMVTPEPAGGSPVPTHPAVITADLT